MLREGFQLPPENDTAGFLVSDGLVMCGSPSVPTLVLLSTLNSCGGKATHVCM